MEPEWTNKNEQIEARSSLHSSIGASEMTLVDAFQLLSLGVLGVEIARGSTQCFLRSTDGPLKPTKDHLSPTEGLPRPKNGTLRPAHGLLRPAQSPFMPTQGPLRLTEPPNGPKQGPLRLI